MREIKFTIIFNSKPLSRGLGPGRVRHVTMKTCGKYHNLPLWPAWVWGASFLEHDVDTKIQELFSFRMKAAPSSKGICTDLNGWNHDVRFETEQVSNEKRAKSNHVCRNRILEAD